MKKKIMAGLRAARVLLMAKAAVGGFAAGLAAYGIGTDFFGIVHPAVTQGTFSSASAVVAVIVAMRA